MINILSIKRKRTENIDRLLSLYNDPKNYLILHFHESTELLFDEKRTRIEPHTITVLNANPVWRTTEGFPAPKIFDKGEQNNDPPRIWNGEFKKPTEGGDGSSEESAILINTPEEFAYVILKIYGEYKYYRLTKDIYLNDINKIDWLTGELLDPDYEPNSWQILNRSYAFNGQFDGDGHVVHGMYLNTDERPNAEHYGAGLFPYMGSATIKNIGVEHSYIEYSNIYGMGAIVGNSQFVGRGLISGCYSSDTVTLCGETAGGILGGGTTLESITIENCYSLANFLVDDLAGSIIGNTWVKGFYVYNCYGIQRPYGQHGGWAKPPMLANVYTCCNWDCFTPVALEDMKGEVAKQTFKGFNFGIPLGGVKDGTAVCDRIYISGDVAKPFYENGLMFNRLYQITDPSFVDQITEELENDHLSPDDISPRFAELKIEELFMKLCRNSKASPRIQIPEDNYSQFDRIRSQMFLSLGDKWSVEMMAKQAGFSISRFYTLYKQLFGVSPTADLISARIEKAKHTLHYTDQKIKDIALSLGYENVTHFTKQFKKYVGKSPAEYRETHRPR